METISYEQDTNQVGLASPSPQDFPVAEDLSTSDRCLVLGANLRLLGHRLRHNIPVLSDDLRRMLPYTDDAEIGRMTHSADRQEARRSRRVQILEFFLARLGERFGTAELQSHFGSAFRTRVSELNRDLLCPIRILNESTAARDERGEPCERSVYWAELRPDEQVQPESDFMRRHWEEEVRDLPLFTRGAP